VGRYAVACALRRFAQAVALLQSAPEPLRRPHFEQGAFGALAGFAAFGAFGAATVAPFTFAVTASGFACAGVGGGRVGFGSWPFATFTNRGAAAAFGAGVFAVGFAVVVVVLVVLVVFIGLSPWNVELTGNVSADLRRVMRGRVEFLVREFVAAQ
jgi:hypothetical protein